MTWTIETVREAPVAAADVFQLYTDPSTWSAWGHAAQWAPGSFHARRSSAAPGGDPRHIVDGRVLVLEVKPPLMTVVQTYAVEPTPTGSRIRHALEISGPLAGTTRLIGLPKAYQRRLDKEVGKVIEMAGRASATQRPMPTTETQPSD